MMSSIIKDPISRNFETVLRIAEMGQIPHLNKTALNRFLDTFEAPPRSMRRLFLVADNLKSHIYPAVKLICQTPPWKEVGQEILPTKRTCNALYSLHRFRSSLKKYTSSLDFDFKRGKNTYQKRNNLCRVVAGDFPLWSTLGHEPAEGEQFPQFFQILAQTLIAIIVLRDIEDDEELHFLKIEALETIRGMANDAEGKGLTAFPAEPLSPEKYLESLRAMPEHMRFRKLEDLIESAIDYLDADEVMPPGLVDIDVDDEDWEYPGYDDEEDEDGGDEETGVDAQPASPPRKDSDQILGRGAIKAMAKANQLFRFSKNELSRGDVHILLSELATPEEDLDGLSVQAQIQIMFWAGFDERRLSEVLLGDDSFLTENSRVDVYDPDTKILYVCSPYPILKSEIRPEAEGQLYPRKPWFPLPLPDSCTTALKDYIKKGNVAHGQRLFPLQPDEIRSRCNTWLTTTKSRSKKKLMPRSLMTIGRIQKYLFNQLSRLNAGDPAVATLTLGKAHYLGRTKVHYLSGDVRFLRRNYLQVVDAVLKEARLPEIEEKS